MIKHEQVPFVTFDNKVVSVDKDIYPVIELLRDLGVRTQFSCQQGVNNTSYVLADWKSFSKLLRQIRRFYKIRAYSEQSMNEVKRFHRGIHQYVFSYFRPNTLEYVSRFMFRRRKELNHYHIEKTYSNRYRGRITVRWPTENIYLIQTLLEETKLLITNLYLKGSVMDDESHPCERDGCDLIVPFDDEPYCFEHAPDNGSWFAGYSYKAKNA